MNKLPKNWIVKMENNNLFYDTVIKYLKDTYKSNLLGIGYCYYGFDGEEAIGTDSKKDYNVLTLSEFIELSKEIEELPEEYIVECDSAEKNREVYANYYNDGYKISSKWNYIICSSKINNAQFKGSGIYPGGHCICHTIPETFSSLKIFSFSEWKELVNQQKTKVEENFPKKWAIKVTEDNLDILTKFYIDNIHLYKGCNISWQILKNYYFHFPQFEEGLHSSCSKKEGYIEVTSEQLKKYLLKQTSMDTKIDYYEVLQTVWGLNGVKFSTGDKLYAENKESLPYFEKVGILKDTTFFKPVYKKEDFKVGDLIIIYKKGESMASQKDFNKIQVITEVFSKAISTKENPGGIYRSEIRKLTPEELKTYENNLLLEAKKKYPFGTIFISAENRNFDKLVIGNTWTIHGNTIKNNGWSVYYNGKWAEILSSLPEIIINGYKGEFLNDYVKFGCAEIDKNQFIVLHEAITKSSYWSNRKVESITIGRGAFSKDQIRQIAEYYLSKK